MPHFFINSSQVDNDKIIISDKENYLHIARSLRSRIGENLLLIDENQIQYETAIEEITNSEIITSINNKYPSKRYLDFELYLAQSPLRSDAQNLLIEKATELGVNGIYPVKTDNCALNSEMIDKKIPKWQKIMYEASKQCERAIVPTCFERTTFEKLFQDVKFDKIIVFCERIASRTIRDSFKDKPIRKGEKVLVIIGPEGGFSQREFDYIRYCKTSGDSSHSVIRRVKPEECIAQNDKIEMLTLGDMILKAETATTVALGNIIYEYSNSDR